MKSVIAALLAAAAFATPATAQQQRPKLIVAITVDQLSEALFSQYRPHFTGGLRRLADGIAFANGYQAHGATETCPGHSTILTGAHPARTGIVANHWIGTTVAGDGKDINCVEDEHIPRDGSDAYTVSALHLRVPTLGDRLKRLDSASRVVAVGGKDRSAVMMGGQAPDQRWWWGDGRFIQNGAVTPAPIVDQVNAAVAASIAQPRAALTPPSFCAERDRLVEVAKGLSVGNFRFDRKAGDADAFSDGPEMDAATLALAAALTQQMQLGRGGATDLLAIGLSATDYVGHAYGNQGLEMCLNLMSLDSDLGGFFAVLDRSGIDYAVVLTADHGALDIPERERRASAARLDPAATASQIGAEVSRRLGLEASAFRGAFFLAETVPPNRRAEVLALARQLLTAHPQVHSVYSKAEVAAHPMPTGKAEDWTILDRLRASFDPLRSGDLAVVYKPEITLVAEPEAGIVANHGSPWDYDRKVPILFWWKGAPHEERNESAMTIDILPTLASLIGLKVPATEIDGRCLDLVAGPESNCR